MASTLPVNGSYGKTSLPWPLPEVWKGEVDKGYFCDDGKETLAARRPAPATADAAALAAALERAGRRASPIAAKKAAEDGGAKLKIEKLFHHGKELDMDKSLSSQGIFRDPTLIEFKKTSLKAWLDHVGIDVGAEDSKDGDGGGAPRPARALERQDSSAVRREQIHDHEQGARFAFEPGDVVECEGPDQRWRLAVVTRASAGGYSVVSAGGYSHGYGRSRPAPRVAERATVAIFGDGPLTWRTYALVRLEERVRIQEGHCDDFEDFDFEAFAREAWTAWLDDGRNASFKKGLRRRVAGRARGARGPVGIPTLVLLFQLRAGRSEPPAICKDRAGSISSRGEGARFTAVMILLVIYFYAVKVIPDAYCKFLETGGGGDGVARLAALRALIFRAEVDSVLQKVGFRVWRVMNGGYEVLLYSLNLYVLFYHHSPLEVILNSLAIEFILEIDERLADPKGGYDPDLRYPVPKPTTGLGVPTKLENSLARSNQSRFG
ncbi:RNA cap guanine-N2 methyltransferase [Aureococcus anophagefferens]|nr:RNA cap guanine-N2 methyltransferase [Aureococcus anophagefferens]